ncbi:shikimate kinase [Aureobasidium pullulans]|nr:shikimate kinase [Aureobasidium pullulans]THY50932.1 shikimate kinase [Aureobasidium pullulans]THZ43195.1 shikimate kinase [Aureobasidium pullulans]TIA34712.1 shikimate kinase [Aureobasidium pullulans]
MLHYEKNTHIMTDPIAPSSSTPMAPATSANTTAPASSAPVPQHRHIWIITGPAGCGKTSVAEYLASYFTLPYLEGDAFHPQANIEKMANSIPLTDADRWDWLILLRDQAVAALESGASGVVLTCSALKRKYRDVIRVASYNDNNVLVHFIYLSATQELLLQRVHGRVGHYMKDSMVKSQFEALEPPTVDERDVMSVDVSGDFASVQQLALEVVNQVMTQDAVIVQPSQA